MRGRKRGMPLHHRHWTRISGPEGRHRPPAWRRGFHAERTLPSSRGRGVPVAFTEGRESGGAACTRDDATSPRHATDPYRNCLPAPRCGSIARGPICYARGPKQTVGVPGRSTAGERLTSAPGRCRRRGSRPDGCSGPGRRACRSGARLPLLGGQVIPDSTSNCALPEIVILRPVTRKPMP
jgi:hypothetical protein